MSRVARYLPHPPLRPASRVLVFFFLRSHDSQLYRRRLVVFRFVLFTLSVLFAMTQFVCALSFPACRSLSRSFLGRIGLAIYCTYDGLLIAVAVGRDSAYNHRNTLLRFRLLQLENAASVVFPSLAGKTEIPVSVSETQQKTSKFDVPSNLCSRHCYLSFVYSTGTT